MRAVQTSLDELGRPLREVTFCVVDLETTGGSAAKGAKVTEVGAVKVRGGQVVGEFQSLVNPDEKIPAFITILTGITDQMVIDAPRIADVLPSFLEFATDCVLVAHNAPFDIGFLKYFCRLLDYEWPAFEILDTVSVARKTLTRDDVPNFKLSTLAAKFHATTSPNHRALDDARATVDVLHALFERLGTQHVTTLEDISALTSRVDPAQRKKAHLADHLRSVPGVYLFRDARDEVLYIGTSRNIRARTRTYFTKSETRSRMGEMVRMAERIEGIECTTPLEAEIREARLIAHHKPPYNRRSKFPDKVAWLKLTQEAWPRLSVVRQILDDGADYIGPFRSRIDADGAMTAIHETFMIRQCTTRLRRHSDQSACALAEMGRCLSPCDGSVTHETYLAEVHSLRETMIGNPEPLVSRITAKMTALAHDERYEDAALWRDRLSSFLHAAARTQRLRAITSSEEIIAGRKQPTGWEVNIICFGRLVGAGVMPTDTDASDWLAALRRSAESVVGGFGPIPRATAYESECVLRWMNADGVRLIHGSWQTPLLGSERHLSMFEPVRLN